MKTTWKKLSKEKRLVGYILILWGLLSLLNGIGLLYVDMIVASKSVFSRFVAGDISSLINITSSLISVVMGAALIALGYKVSK